MADTVGAVYVRVMSDSSGFAKQLRKEGAKAGTKASTAFGKSFHEGATKDLNKLNLERVLSPKIEEWGRDFAKQVTIAERSGKNLDINFSIGQIVSDDELRSLATRLNLTFSEVQSYVRKVLPAAARSGFAAIDKESAANARKQKARDRERVDFWLKEMRRIRPLSDIWSNTNFRNVLWRLGDDIQKIVTPAMRDALKKGARVNWLETDDAEARIRKLADTYRISFSDAERAVRREIQRTLTEREQSLSWFSKVRGQMRGLLSDSKLLDKRMTGVYRAFRKMGTGGFFDSATTAMGGFILSTYKLGRAAGSLVSTFGKVFSKIGEGIVGLGEQMGGLGGPLKSIGGLVSSLGSGMASLASSGVVGLAAVAAAAVALVGILGAAVHVMSALVAGAVALGSALYFVVAQAAFLLPIVGALGLGFVAMAVGGWDAGKSVGLLVKAMNEADPKKRAAAMKEYTDSLKSLGKNARSAVGALKPLIEGFDDFKKDAGEALFDGMAAAIKASSPLVDALKDGLVRVAGAVGNVIEGFLRLGEDTVFMRDFNIMLDLSVGLIESLGAAAKDVFAGLNSFFAAMSPVVKLFGEDIKGIAKSFKDWAQSEGGQNAILEFFTIAREMGLLFWGLLKEVGGALHDLFTDPATVEAAKSLLTFLTDEIKKFRDWIAEISKNGQLAQWFEDAKVAGKVLWDVMLGVIKAIGSLLTPENLLMLKAIGAYFLSWVNVLVLVVHAVGTVVSVVAAMFTLFKNAIVYIINGWKFVYDVVTTVIAKFNAARTAGKSMSDSIKAGINGIRDAWDRFMGRLRSIKWPTPPAWLSKAWGAITGKAAAGGMFLGPTTRLIGEEGPEMVIPLHRPLSRIDPSVRGMAAMMRGSAGTAGATTNSRQMTNYWTVNSPSPDGRVVASQVVNRMAAMAG